MMLNAVKCMESPSDHIPIHGPAKPEVQSIEVGIDRVISAFSLDRLLVFDDLHGFLDELQSFSRELDEMGEPTDSAIITPSPNQCKLEGIEFDANLALVEQVQDDEINQKKNRVARPCAQSISERYKPIRH